MTTYFPGSGVEIAIWIPPVVALVVSFGTSMGGLSGALLLLPFQMSFLGYTTPSVSATNQVFNVVAVPSGVWRYVREGRMVWPLCLLVIAGSVPGAVIGALIRVSWLRDPGHFKVFVALVLVYIGGRMIRDLVRPPVRGARTDGVEQRFQALAIVGGIYGIGGGALIAPLLVMFFRLPVYTVAGTALMATCATSVAGVAIYHALALAHPTQSIAPDWLGLLFGVGGIVGMYLGARCQKYVPSRAIRGMLSAVILLTAARYLIDLASP